MYKDIMEHLSKNPQHLLEGNTLYIKRHIGYDIWIWVPWYEEGIDF